MGTVNLGLNSLFTEQSGGYAVADEAIRGGFRVVATASQSVTESRLNQLVAFGRRTRGMLVYDTTNEEIWQCTDPGTGAEDGAWSRFTFPITDLDGGSY